MTDVDVERFRAAVRAVRSSRSVVLITEEVLALLDRLEAAEAENERLREWSDKHCTAATRGTDAAHALRQQVEELTAENEALRAWREKRSDEISLDLAAMRQKVERGERLAEALRLISEASTIEDAVPGVRHIARDALAEWEAHRGE